MFSDDLLVFELIQKNLGTFWTNGMIQIYTQWCALSKVE